MTQTTGGAEGLTFYNEQSVMRLLDLRPVEFSDITNSGLLLAIRIRSDGQTEPEQRYAAPYVQAVRTQMNLTGQRGIEVFRRVANSSGGQVNEMIGSFTRAVKSRAEDGAVSDSSLMELFGWDQTKELHAHRFGAKPTASVVLGRVAWRHTILPEVKFLSSSQASEKILGVSNRNWKAVMSYWTVKKRVVLAQRVHLANQKSPVGGDSRYPQSIIAFEHDYATRHGHSFIEAVQSVDEAKIATRTRLERLTVARFVASVYRNADCTGRVPVDKAAQLVGLTRRNMKEKQLHDSDGRISIADLFSVVRWSKDVHIEEPEARIFTPPFDTTWQVPSWQDGLDAH